jgi:hypothetical protein
MLGAAGVTASGGGYEHVVLWVIAEMRMLDCCPGRATNFGQFSLFGNISLIPITGITGTNTLQYFPHKGYRARKRYQRSRNATPPSTTCALYNFKSTVPVVRLLGGRILSLVRLRPSGCYMHLWVHLAVLRLVRHWIVIHRRGIRCWDGRWGWTSAVGDV